MQTKSIKAESVFWEPSATKITHKDSGEKGFATFFQTAQTGVTPPESTPARHTQQEQSTPVEAWDEKTQNQSIPAADQQETTPQPVEPDQAEGAETSGDKNDGTGDPENVSVDKNTESSPASTTPSPEQGESIATAQVIDITESTGASDNSARVVHKESAGVNMPEATTSNQATGPAATSPASTANPSSSSNESALLSDGPATAAGEKALSAQALSAETQPQTVPTDQQSTSPTQTKTIQQNPSASGAALSANASVDDASAEVPLEQPAASPELLKVAQSTVKSDVVVKIPSQTNESNQQDHVILSFAKANDQGQDHPTTYDRNSSAEYDEPKSSPTAKQTGDPETNTALSMQQTQSPIPTSELPGSQPRKNMQPVEIMTGVQDKTSAGSRDITIGRMLGADKADSSMRLDMQENIDRVVKAAQMAMNRGSSRIQLRLEPPELGTLHVDIRHDGRGLQLHLQASTSKAQQLLQQHSNELRSALEARGFQAAQIEVNLRLDLRNNAAPEQQQQQSQSHSQQGQSFDQQQGQSQQRGQSGFQSDGDPWENSEAPSKPEWQEMAFAVLDVTA